MTNEIMLNKKGIIKYDQTVIPLSKSKQKTFTIAQGTHIKLNLIDLQTAKEFTRLEKGQDQVKVLSKLTLNTTAIYHAD